MASGDMEAALLKWINTFPLTTAVTALDGLANGHVLAKALADIDPAFDEHDVDASAPSVLGAVTDALARYIRRECPSLVPLVEAQAVKALVSATAPSEKNIVELLQVFVMAAVMGPMRGKYVPAITSLDPETQAMIAQLIQKKQKDLEEQGGPDVAPPDDAELEFEKQYGELLAQKQKADRENEHMKKKMADLNTRLETLTINHDKLQALLAETQDTLARSRDEDSAAIIQSKQMHIQERDELIESQEAQLEQFRTEKKQMQRTIDQLKSAEDRALQLGDEVQVLKHENTELAKKANTVDRYKQKLEAQKDFEKQNKDLSAELTEIRDQMRRYDAIEARNELLESTHRKYQELNDKYELDLIDMINQKDHLKKEVARLEGSVTMLKTAKANDEKIISELQELSNHGSSSAATGASSGLNLETELEQSELEPAETPESSRLKAESDHHKGTAAGQEAKRLQIELEDLIQIRKHLETKYNLLFEESTITNDQLSAVLEGSLSEGSHTFGSLRKQHMQASHDLDEAKTMIGDLERDLEKAKRDLVDTKADLDAIAKTEREAVDDLKAELKAAEGSVNASLQADLTKLQSQHKILKADYDQQKSHLVETLLSKDKMSKEIDTAQASLKAKGELESELAAAKAKITELEAENAKIAELKAKADAMEPGKTPAEEDSDAEIENMRRENSLIATAWYDITSRLQSNNITVQRRPDVPKSFLNKQRHMMHAAPRKTGVGVSR